MFGEKNRIEPPITLFGANFSKSRLKEVQMLICELKAKKVVVTVAKSEKEG